jgi:cholinesterase
MQPQLPLLLSLASLSSAIGVSEPHVVRHSPQVKLDGGSVIHGVVEHAYPSVRQFLGIPYAQPPVEELRWEAPQALQLPQSVNATALGRSCTQFLATIPSVANQDVLEFNIQDANSTGEDCLTLSVWTPQHAKGLPVLVFIYGGGWYWGGQNEPYQIPTQWVQRTKDLIVVVPK